jgi:hypothetical protein
VNQLQHPRYINKKQTTTKREGGRTPKPSQQEKAKEIGTKVKPIKKRKSNKRKSKPKKNKTIWMPTPGTGVMNLKTLLHRPFLGLRHHHSERLFSSSSTIIQEIDSCPSLFLVSISSMLNVSNILTIPILLQNLQVMKKVIVTSTKVTFLLTWQ